VIPSAPLSLAWPEEAEDVVVSADGTNDLPRSAVLGGKNTFCLRCTGVRSYTGQTREREAVQLFKRIVKRGVNLVRVCPNRGWTGRHPSAVRGDTALKRE